MGEAIDVDFPDIGNLADIAQRLPQFEFIELVGRGGMGVIYKARQPHLDRLVAIKILPPEDALSPLFVERFRREARTLARLSHPNIVTVHDFGEAGPLFYFVMEYVDGVNLREMEESARLSPTQALAIVPKICEALQAAHDLGIVHRDIKPENILIDRAGQVKIADFGIARIVRGDTPISNLTGTAQVVGTPRYMAPEQATGSENVDHRADIFSLGVVFYEMLTGTAPSGHFAPPSQKVQVDLRLDQVVLKALEQEPERRYQRAKEMQTDVEAIRAEPASSSAPRRQAKDSRGFPKAAAFAGAAVLLALAIVLFAGNRIKEAWLQARAARQQRALIAAAGQGDVAAIQASIAAGADLNGIDAEGLSPLHHASAAGRIRAVQWLVLHGADFNSRDLQLRTPLIMAAEANQPEVIETLDRLDQAILGSQHALQPVRSPGPVGPDLLAPAPEPPATIAEALARFDEVIPREFLRDVEEGALSTRLERGAQDVQGQTALMKAVVQGHVPAALAIHPHGEEGLVDHSGHTVAMLAAIHGRTEVVQGFLRKPNVGYGTAIGNLVYHGALSPGVTRHDQPEREDRDSTCRGKRAWGGGRLAPRGNGTSHCTLHPRHCRERPRPGSIPRKA